MEDQQKSENFDDDYSDDFIEEDLSSEEERLSDDDSLGEGLSESDVRKHKFGTNTVNEEELEYITIKLASETIKLALQEVAEGNWDVNDALEYTTKKFAAEIIRRAFREVADGAWDVGDALEYITKKLAAEVIQSALREVAYGKDEDDTIDQLPTEVHQRALKQVTSEILENYEKALERTTTKLASETIGSALREIANGDWDEVTKFVAETIRRALQEVVSENRPSESLEQVSIKLASDTIRVALQEIAREYRKGETLEQVSIKLVADTIRRAFQEVANGVWDSCDASEYVSKQLSAVTVRNACQDICNELWENESQHSNLRPQSVVANRSLQHQQMVGDGLTSESVEFLQQLINGMGRSMSGRTSQPTPRNSLMFDEESFEPLPLALHNSGGEIYGDGGSAADSVALPTGGDQGSGTGSRFIGVASDSEEGGYWSPKHAQGYEADYQDEKWSSDHQNRSNVWLFSEESNNRTPISLSTQTSLQQESERTVGGTPQASTISGSSSSSETTGTSESDEEEEEDKCCMNCGGENCKMRILADAGFPLPYMGGWRGGWGGMPFYSEPGVPLTNLNNATEEQMQLLNECGIDKKDLGKGKVTIWVDKDSDNGCDKAADKRCQSAASTIVSNASEVSGGEVFSCAGTAATSRCSTNAPTDVTRATSRADDLLAAAREKKLIADEEIERAKPIKETLLEFFEKGKFNGSLVEAAMDSYNEVYHSVNKAIGEWRDELKKLDIDADDYNVGLKSCEDLMRSYQKEEPKPSAMCESVQILTKLSAKVADLVKTLPMDEFDRLGEFIDQTEAEKRAMEREDAQRAESLAKTNVSEKGESVNDHKQGKCQKNCHPSGEANQSLKEIRKQMVDDLTNQLHKKASKSHMQAGDFDGKKKRKKKSKPSSFSINSTVNLNQDDPDMQSKSTIDRKPRSVFDVPKATKGYASSIPSESQLTKVMRESYVKFQESKPKKKQQKIPPSLSEISMVLNKSTRSSAKSVKNPIPKSKSNDPMASERMRLRRVRLGLDDLNSSRPSLERFRFMNSLIGGIEKSGDCEPDDTKKFKEYVIATNNIKRKKTKSNDITSDVKKLSTGTTLPSPVINSSVLQRPHVGTSQTYRRTSARMKHAGAAAAPIRKKIANKFY